MTIRDFFTSDELASMRAPIGDALTLPREAFVSDDFHGFERDRIFFRSWVAIAFAHQVAEPGDVLPVEFLDVPLVLIRGSDRRLRVFHNVGRHDACPVVREPTRAQTELVAPYHGWRYSLDGRLLGAPLWDGRSDSPASLAGRGDLCEVPAEEWLDFVFVNLSGDGVGFDAHVAPAREHLADFDLSPLAIGRRENGEPDMREESFDANWKTVFENATINVLHESFVHDLYRRSPDVPRVDGSGRKTFEEVCDRGLFGIRLAAHESRSTYPPLPIAGLRSHGGEPPKSISLLTLYPNVSIAVMTEHAHLSIHRPCGPTRTGRVCANYFVGDAATDPGSAPLREAVFAAWQQASREDAAVCSAIQRARRSPFTGQGFYSPFWESMHYAFNQRLLDDLERPDGSAPTRGRNGR